VKRLLWPASTSTGCLKPKRGTRRNYRTDPAPSGESAISGGAGLRSSLQAKYELEALQQQRRGEATPLARLDVQGGVRTVDRARQPDHQHHDAARRQARQWHPRADQGVGGAPGPLGGDRNAK
jgi:hypothetical protein